jgi:hypothetical protein
LGDTRECPGQNTFYGLKTNFIFQQLFSALLLSGSDHERKRELAFKGRKKRYSALKSGSAHVALAVQYKPLAGI